MRFKALWSEIHDSLWFLPALLTLAGAVLALILVRVDPYVLGDVDARKFAWLFGGAPEGARGVLSAIASSIITVTGVVFSVTIVALQLASSQFTPRVLRQFMGDRANQLVLGVFIGTFTYTLLVQRTVRASNEDGAAAFVPSVAVTGAVLLALLSIAFLIFFIDHLARSIQAENVIDMVTRQTMEVLDRMADHDDQQGAIAWDEAPVIEGEPCIVAAPKAGYIQHVSEGELLQKARKHGLLVRVERRVGEFLFPGERLLAVWRADGVDEDVANSLLDAVIIGHARTPQQDFELGVVELVDITVKGLSPAVNDPTTAIVATDRLAELLLRYASRKRARYIQIGDAEGRVIARRSEFGHLVRLGFDQIRRFGADNPSFIIKLMRTLGRLGARLPAELHKPVLRQIALARSGAEAAARQDADRRAIRRGAAEAARLVRGTRPDPI